MTKLLEDEAKERLDIMWNSSPKLHECPSSMRSLSLLTKRLVEMWLPSSAQPPKKQPEGCSPTLSLSLSLSLLLLFVA